MGPCHHSSNIVTCQDSSGGRGAASFGRSSSINVLLGGGRSNSTAIKEWSVCFFLQHNMWVSVLRYGVLAFRHDAREWEAREIRPKVITYT